MQKKILTVIAGPNGAGKTTFMNEWRKQGHARGVYLNPDAISREIEQSEKITDPYALFKRSQIETEIRREILLQAGASMTLETVFSHESKVDFMRDAKSYGFHTVLLFVGLDNPEISRERVKFRVQNGGHDVPEDKIFSRYPRTLENLTKAIPIVNECHILDNSIHHDDPRVAVYENGKQIWKTKNHIAWFEKLKI